MRSLATKQPSNQDSAHQKSVRVAPVRTHSLSTVSSGLTVLQRQPSCACGGRCPRCQEQALLQTKLKISEPGDRYEQEADRIADQVMRMLESSESQAEIVQKKAIADSPPDALEVPSIVPEVLNSLGQPLDSETRSLMESRLGHDFSQVQVHDDPKAAESTQAVDAKAYTVGHHVVFGANQYQPQANAGRYLLAHELVHVMQQSAGTPTQIQRQGREGTTRFEEHMAAPPTQQAGVWQGTVDRRVIAPASGSTPQQVVHNSQVNLRFDPSTCKVTIPHRFAFQQRPQAVNAGTCDEPPSTTPVGALSTDAFNAIKSRYISTLNEGLRGWYAARIEGCQGSPCAGQQIPIQIEVREDPAHPDTRIDVVNRGGRADAGTICARDTSEGTTIHEGGHQVLGAGDEYREPDPAVCRTVPEWCRVERVRTTDWSRMSKHHSYGRFALFHDRHFQFVPEFLRSIYPSCQANLVELARPVIPDFRVSLELGYANLSGSGGGYYGLGLAIGVPLDRLREWNLLLGVHGSLLGSLDRPQRQAFLIGARLGLERTATPSAGGFQIGGFGELGYSRSSVVGSQESKAPYGEIGLRVGYAFSPSLPLSLGVEGAAGTQFGAGRIGDPSGGTSSAGHDAETLHWLRLGLSLGARF
jgi:Domain of unknown function (DUF4157)